MNTKKAHWISTPEKIKTTLHSFRYESESEHSVFFILPENGEVDILLKGSARTAFTLLHTPEEFILFRKDMTIISFGDIREHVPMEIGERMKLIKEGAKLSFYSGEKLVLSIEKEAFRTSVSFGASSKGEGEVYIEVF